MQLSSLLVAAVLLLLLVAVERGSSTSWDEERLMWLTVTKPGAQNVQLNCTSEHIYPFYLLNDTSVIGAIGSNVKRVWWLLPDGKQVNDSYDDGNRRVVDRGVGLEFRLVIDGVHGLYHCAVEASTRINDTVIDPNRTSVYYYKRGLNLYGADVFTTTWDKYKRNTLIGSLAAGAFLALVAGYALLDHLGIFAKCAKINSNTVDALYGGGDDSCGVKEPVAVEAAEMAAAPVPADSPPPEHSRASVRSRRSEQQPDRETAA